MRRSAVAWPACALLSAALLRTAAVSPPDGLTPLHDRRMSFSNRLLLNRAVVSGLQSIEVLLLVAPYGPSAAGAVTPIASRVPALGGRIIRSEPAIGYLRIEIPVHRLLDVVNAPGVNAYQIASQSRGSWYRDGPPMRNATVARSFETTPVDVTLPKIARPDLPVLSHAESRAAGFTADDAGVGRWLKEHPTFDGRGVTIALLEHAQPSFMDPTVRAAKTLDGRDVPKIAGILNAADETVADETRVTLDTIVAPAKTWTRIGTRTYILPRPVTYRFGIYDVPAGANLVHRFAVIQDAKTQEVWIDTNGDGSFADETPLADVNQRFEPQYLTLKHPGSGRVAFVMSRGRQLHVVHIYLSRGSHQTMTLSVAAGSRTDDGLAFGVAPNARVLLVRMLSNDAALAASFEGFIDAAQRPDVDVIGTSWGIMMVPDTDAGFTATFLRRLMAVYRKPIFTSAANQGPVVGSAHHGALSVGGVLSPATWAALYGGRPLGSTIVHPVSAAGPSIDGAIKPDFLAPMERISADLPWNAPLAAVPQNAPTQRLPPGYQLSCCTSATSPYATGAAALLISAAKQTGVPLSADRLGEALRFSARPLPGAPAHQQGNGLLDIAAAWRALTQPEERPRITASTAIVHPLAQYAHRGEQGVGIFEFEGWSPGRSGTRTLTFTRRTGPATPLTYQLTWSASDGSFSTPASVTLPLDRPVDVAVRIRIRSAGVHSGLLELRDKAGTVIFRTQATIVAAGRVDPSRRVLRVTDTLTNLEHRNHYVRVPPGTTAIAFELAVTRGVVNPTIVPSHGLFPSYYLHVYPMNVFYVGKGKYVVRLPNPAPGTWTFQLRATSTQTGMLLPMNPVRPDDSDVEYALTVRLEDESSVPAESALDVSPGYVRLHTGRFLASGLPNVFDIDVPADASALSLRLRADPGAPKTELYLYDCTGGECFSYNMGFPAAGAHTLVVRKPGAGRWVAAVNAAPVAGASGAFVLDELVTIGTPVRRVAAAARGPRSRWEEAIGDVTAPPAKRGRTSVVVAELIDVAAERAEVDHPWSTAPNYVTLRDRPIALQTAIYPR